MVSTPAYAEDFGSVERHSMGIARLRRLVGAETESDVTALDAVVARLWVAAEDGRIYHPRTMAEIQRARARKQSYVERGTRERPQVSGGVCPEPP